MKEPIYWEKEGPKVRLAVVELCGWRNKNGRATPMGKRIARTSWAELTKVAQDVLIRHGVNQ